jgi:arsenate reductase
MGAIAMREAGVDISAQGSKRISDVPLGRVDTVITLCAEELCVTLPGIIRRATWVFPDPAMAEERLDEVLDGFRRIRDELRGRIERFSAERSGRTL